MRWDRWQSGRSGVGGTKSGGGGTKSGGGSTKSGGGGTKSGGGGTKISISLIIMLLCLLERKNTLANFKQHTEKSLDYIR